jgi:lipopolysaccharide transport system ATP-binding protein
VTTAIRIENVSKLYRLGTVGTGTIAHDLNRWWHQIRGKEDPYTKVGQVNDRTKKSSVVSGQSPETAAAENGRLLTSNSWASGPDYVWALRDINLEVQQGDILGVIGRNGAGKSTLLKLLSRVTAPTTGTIKTKGRIASLLEVGTGFHPEMTGRENVYMNGAILGMRNREITSQLEEIVEFSGCAKYLDTPVKRYSSGMTVRLGFAVAAHLNPEILIVDEVLAVGDQEFQHRCLGKMNEVASQGRTVLFVSHNMASIAKLCKTGVVLSNGEASETYPIQTAIAKYFESSMDSASQQGVFVTSKPDPNTPVNIQRIETRQSNVQKSTIRHDKPFELCFQLTQTMRHPGLRLSISVCDRHFRKVFTTATEVAPGFSDDAESSTWLSATIASRFLMPGEYSVIAGIVDANHRILQSLKYVCNFTISDAGDEQNLRPGSDYGVVFADCVWSHSESSTPESSKKIASSRSES